MTAFISAIFSKVAQNLGYSAGKRDAGAISCFPPEKGMPSLKAMGIPTPPRHPYPLLLAAFHLLFPILLPAQNKTDKIDSLKTVIEKAGEDTVKARSLCRLCDQLRKKGRMDEALKTGVEGLKLAEKLKDRKGEGICLNNLGIVYESQGDYGKAAEFYLKSLKIKEEIGDQKGIATCLNNLGVVYYSQEDYGRAAEHYLKSLKIREAIGDKKGIAACLGNLGEVYLKLGDWGIVKANGKAAEHYLKSLKIREEIGDKNAVLHTLDRLTEIYWRQENYKKVTEYNLKSLKIREEIGDKNAIAHSLLGLGGVYRDQGDYGKAVEYYHKCLKIYEEIGDKNDIALCRRLLGIAYRGQGDYGKAAEHYHKCLKIWEEIGDKNKLALCWSELSDICLETGCIAEARELARKSLSWYIAQHRELVQERERLKAIRDTINNPGMGGYLASNFLLLARIDSASGNFRAAFEHYKLYHTYSDSLREDEQRQKMTEKIASLEARGQYELEAAEQKRKEEIAAAEEAEKQERVYTFQSLGIFGFVVLMVFSLFFLGKFNPPVWFLKGMLYISLIMTFEFAILLFDPLNDKYSQGLPIYKMLFNTGLALFIGPLHGFMEKKLKKRLLKEGQARWDKW